MGMSRYSVAEEITPVRADFLVELRGAENIIGMEGHECRERHERQTG
jgi:hypothetical protein